MTNKDAREYSQTKCKTCNEDIRIANNALQEAKEETEKLYAIIRDQKLTIDGLRNGGDNG